MLPLLLLAAGVSGACDAPLGSYCVGNTVNVTTCPSNFYCGGGTDAPVAAVYIAASGGSSGALGTYDAPVDNLGEAIGLAASRLIVAMPGTYSTCGWAFDAPISIAAKEGTRVVFNGCRMSLSKIFGVSPHVHACVVSQPVTCS